MKGGQQDILHACYDHQQVRVLSHASFVWSTVIWLSRHVIVSGNKVWNNQRSIFYYYSLRSRSDRYKQVVLRFYSYGPLKR